MSIFHIFKKKSLSASVSVGILKKPVRSKGRIEKGVLIINQCDALCGAIRDLKRYFYIVERRGWVGANDEKTADIKLVDDLGTVDETRRKFPNAILLEFANADFVNTDVFRPLGEPKEFMGIQVSAWVETKRHELFVKGVALIPDRKFIKFGHFWSGGDGTQGKAEKQLKKNTINLSKALGANIYYPFEGIDTNESLPMDAESMNALINQARMGILTTKLEGVNRFKMECLAANIPVLVPKDTSDPTKKHINDKTGVLFDPTPQGLADAIMAVERNYNQFSPREYLLKHSGIHNALNALRRALVELAQRDGADQNFDDVYWDGRNQSMGWDREQSIAEIRRIISQV